MTDYVLDSSLDTVGLPYSPVFITAFSDATAIESNDTGISIDPVTLTGGTDVRGAYSIDLLDRIRSNWPTVIEKAIRVRAIHPNPVQSLVQFLDSIPGDYDSWIEIVEEPYG